MSNVKTVTIDLQHEKEKKKNESVVHKKDTIKSPLFIIGIKKKFVIIRIRLSIVRIAINCYKNPIYWLGVIRYFKRFRKRYLGNHKHNRIAYIDGKYYMGLYTPGWKGKAFNKFIVSLLNDYKPIPNRKINKFMIAYIAITKKCPLKCEHCYEWDNLNNKEVLTVDKLNNIVSTIQEHGVGQIQFSGGEPLNRMEDLIEVLKQAKDNTDFWVTTSGFNLSDKNAKTLKEAGLTGVVISLDHFNPERHNDFRGNKNAFYWAEEAVKNATTNKLVTALSLCVSKDFVSKENLLAYMHLAKEMNISFVQLLEPKSVGHYADTDVTISGDQIKILEDFVMEFNFNSSYSNYPFIIYHAYYERRHGCFNAGYKGLYIDTDGDMNPCPFCHKKTGSVLDGKFEQNLELLRANGCQDNITDN